MRKNLVKGLVIGAMALGMAGMYGYGTEAATYRLGDVNLDGKVNLSDAQTTLKAALGITSIDGISKKAADINQDGKVNLGDAQLTLKVALGISTVDGTVSDEEEPAPSVEPSTAPEVTEEPKQSDAPTVEPTESAQPTETTDDGVEGVDWKWETRTGYFTYCYCGKLLDVDENGFLITDQQKADEFAEKHMSEGTTDSILGAITGGMTDEEFMSAISNAKNHGGYKVLYRTETYKVRLK